MGSLVVRSSQIIDQTALTVPGNATGSAAACTDLTGTQLRALLSLETTSDVTFDIVRATTSVQTPLVNNSSAALTLTGGPDAGYFNVEGVMLKTVSSATAYLRAGAGILYLHQTGLGPGYIYQRATGNLEIVNQTTNGDIDLLTYGASGYVNIYNNTHNGVLRVGTVENSAAQPITLGNSTYGVTVPGWGVFSGNVAADNYGIRIINAAANGYSTIQFGGTDAGIYRLGPSQSSYAGPNSMMIGTVFGHNFAVITNNLVRTTWDGNGAATFSGGTTTFSNPNYPLGSILIKQQDASGIFSAGSAAQGIEFRYYSTGQARLGIGVDNSGVPSIEALTGIPLVVKAVTGTSFSGDISMSKTSAQGYVYAYDTGGTKYTRTWHNGSNGFLGVSSGNLGLQPVTGLTACVATGVNSALEIYDSSNGKACRLTHDGTQAVLSTTFGNLWLSPVAGSTIQATRTINMSSGATQGYINAYDTGGTKYTSMYHDGTNGWISTSAGVMVLSAAGGQAVVYTPGSVAELRVTDAAGYNYTKVLHNGTDGTIQASIGEMLVRGQTFVHLQPTNGTTYCYTAGTNSTFNVLDGSAQGLNITSNGTNTVFNTTIGAIVFTPQNSIIGIGGITSSHPALKRSSTTLAVRLGDDSADAPITCAGITASGLVRGAETTSTPSGTTQTITLETGNCQTLDLTSSTGDVTATLTVPASSARGSLLIKQHATTSRDITWAASSGTITWLGTEPTWNADATSSFREVEWRFNGTNTFLIASGSS